MTNFILPDDEGIGTGGIVGIAVGGILIVALGVGAGIFIYMHILNNKRKNKIDTSAWWGGTTVKLRNIRAVWSAPLLFTAEIV